MGFNSAFKGLNSVSCYDKVQIKVNIFCILFWIVRLERSLSKTLGSYTWNFLTAGKANRATGWTLDAGLQSTERPEVVNTNPQEAGLWDICLHFILTMFPHLLFSQLPVSKGIKRRRWMVYDTAYNVSSFFCFIRISGSWQEAGLAECAAASLLIFLLDGRDQCSVTW
jgi:hypothetical protein